MKKIAIMLMFGMVLAMVGCGSDKSIKSNEELEKKVAELEAENKELREQKDNTEQEIVDLEYNIADIEAEIASWSDDMVIAFSDEQLQSYVKKVTGVSSREITYGDVKNITEIENCVFDSINSLKYFSSLKKLYVEVENDTNLDGLKYCRELENLAVFGDNLEDISAVGTLNKLVTLEIQDADSYSYDSMNPYGRCYLGNGENDISNIDSLGNLRNLTYLCISGDGITDISALGDLTNLTILGVSGDGITDINALENLTNLYCLCVYGDNITDISVLGNLTNLNQMKIFGDGIVDISVLGNLSNLDYLEISGDSITDISALGNLTQLSFLGLYCDNITDMSALEKIEDAQNERGLFQNKSSVRFLDWSGQRCGIMINNFEYITPIDY